PVWKAEELGRPIPDSVHAVSVALPRWQDVVGYEEKSPEVMARLPNGYPRFVIHPLVQELAHHIGGDRPCLPFPSRRAAEMCAEFIRRSGAEPSGSRRREEAESGVKPAATEPPSSKLLTPPVGVPPSGGFSFSANRLKPGHQPPESPPHVGGYEARIVEKLGVHGVVTTDAGALALKAFWQHTGLIVSTRQAEAILAGRSGDDAVAVEARRSLRWQLADFYDCAEDDVFLAPTGMTAQFAALRAVMKRSPGLPTAQLGFPYVDTLKLQQKFGHGATLLHNLDTISDDLHALIHSRHLAACFGEIPGNPLLGSADLSRIQPLLREHRVPLVADDVVATPFNVDLSRHADLIATSLTKYIVGTGDAMGGALICHPRSPFHAELKAIVRAQHEELLWGTDAAVLDAQARSFPERMRRHNANGLLIAERLRAHPAVEKVWYPKWEFSEVYEAVRRPDGGYGSLITFLPKNAETTSPRIYDNMAVCKGPSLGTIFTLACPFTLLAHYTELDWAESCGVSRYLIRLSVGFEDPGNLWQRLDSALRSV
ncbi:MAG: PLP-dependent transferase, partial [Verrucomicrobia bacterium]|nr:PLP-dependent transferase [Verrucomicrobiota bacterium]